MKEELLFTPTEHMVKSSLGYKFLKYIEQKENITIEDEDTYTASYDKLHSWSIENIAKFHEYVWDFCEITGIKGEKTLQNEENMQKSIFFEDSELNYAENLLKKVKKTPDQPAIISRIAGQKNDRILTWQQLYEQVSIWQQLLEQTGITEGDRIATYLPHIAEAYIIHIAAANLGAIFSSVGTEMGAQATADRFNHIKPKLLIAVDGYNHMTHKGEKVEDRLHTIETLQKNVSSLERTLIIANKSVPTELSTLNANTLFAHTLLKNIKPKTLEYKKRPFNHPLSILFSSGSTGKPKCFVHSTGGLLLKHAIEHQLQNDVRDDDCVFFHTTTSWMMFNWLLSGLAQGATILIYEGSPFFPNPDAHLQFASDYKCTHLGTAAGLIQDIWRANNINAKELDLSHLRAISYTGSVLSPEGFKYVHDNIKADMSINGICGGTDFVGCYASGNSFVPTYAGCLKGPVLGMSTQILDENANTKPKGEIGELVITKPFVSCPLYFWGDEKNEDNPRGVRFTESYFNYYKDIKPPIWHHGDAVKYAQCGQLIVEGRSDSTLNQNGVRIGSQMIYDALDNSPLKKIIDDTIAVNFKDQEGGDHTVLFIVLKKEQTLTNELKTQIQKILSDKVGRLCVPHEIRQVPYILKTPNGKKAEKPTKTALITSEVKAPETYGIDEENKTYKTELFIKIGQELRLDKKYRSN